jgi:predicted membrane metal-binding protein
MTASVMFLLSNALSLAGIAVLVGVLWWVHRRDRDGK